MAGVFDVKNMEERLGKHIPEGETLLAGVHCVNKELQVLRYYQNSAPYINKYVYLRDIGHCFKLSDIETCEFKKGLFEEIVCGPEVDFVIGCLDIAGL